MTKENKPRPLLDVWDFARVNWKAQLIGNAFFGLPLVVINGLSEGFSLSVISWIVILYVSIYVSFFVPFFGAVSYFFLKPLNVIFDKVAAGNGTSRSEIAQALSSLLNLPIKSVLVVVLSVPLGFVAAALVLRSRLIPEFLPVIDAVTAVTVVLGLAVTAIHAFLVYIFSETYLRRAVEFLVSVDSFFQKDLRIIRVSLFRKILFLVLLTVIATQLSLATFFLAKIGLDLPREFLKTFWLAAAIIVLSFSFVVVIARDFTRNLTYPLERLISWAKGIGRRDFKQGLELMTNDELVEVVEYLKKMFQEMEESKNLLEIKVAARTKELQELADGLEGQVKERTQELQKRLAEVERFNRLTVGREIRMAELKKEIRQLREEMDKKISKLDSAE